MKAYTERGQKVLEYVLEHVPRNGSHGLNHILRVWKFGMELGKKLGANLEILEPALLLHDIIRTPETENVHASLSAREARKILPRFGYTDEEVEQIVHCIRNHSDSEEGSPESLEAKILYDADKVDGLGPEGVKRVIALAKEKGMDLETSARWYKERIETALAKLHFPESRELAKRRLDYSLAWIERILNEKRKN